MLASVLHDASLVAPRLPRGSLGPVRRLHSIDGEVVVVDGRSPPDELDAHRRRAPVEVVVLDLCFDQYVARRLALPACRLVLGRRE